MTKSSRKRMRDSVHVQVRVGRPRQYSLQSNVCMLRNNMSKYVRARLYIITQVATVYMYNYYILYRQQHVQKMWDGILGWHSYRLEKEHKAWNGTRVCMYYRLQMLYKKRGVVHVCVCTIQVAKCCTKSVGWCVYVCMYIGCDISLYYDTTCGKDFAYIWLKNLSLLSRGLGCSTVRWIILRASHFCQIPTREKRVK